MKPYERRAKGAYPYFVLATWNDKLQCFQDLKATYTSASNAKGYAKTIPGRYRIAQVNEDGSRIDGKPFEVK